LDPFERDLRLEFTDFFILVIDDLSSFSEHLAHGTVAKANMPDLSLSVFDPFGNTEVVLPSNFSVKNVNLSHIILPSTT
jgi:hypothetical protein